MLKRGTLIDQIGDAGQNVDSQVLLMQRDPLLVDGPWKVCQSVVAGIVIINTLNVFLQIKALVIADMEPTEYLSLTDILFEDFGHTPVCLKGKVAVID